MEIVQHNRGDYLSTLETSLDCIIDKYNLQTKPNKANSDMSSRTAALSRYLQALDSPPPAANPATPAAPAPAPPLPSTDQNEFEALFPNNDLYSGNKVVAMPSLGGKSVREVVSSRNVTPGRPRSHSTGRSSQPRSRDLVQDVYDRMGVSRDDLTTDADKFAERYRAAAALSATAATQQQQRGRSIASPNMSSDGQRRARSLSRGRSVTERWPPTRSQVEASEAAVSRPAPPSPVDVSNNTNKHIDTSAGESTVQNHVIEPSFQQAKSTHRGKPVEDITATNRINRGNPSYPDPIPPWKRLSKQKSNNPSVSQKSNNPSVSQKSNTPSVSQKSNNPSVSQKSSSACGSIRTSPSFEIQSQASPSEEQEEELNAAEAAKALSVKDRVKTLSGGKSNRNFPKRTYPVKYVKRDHPPPIDIFKGAGANPEGSVTVTERQEEQPMMAPEPSNVPPSAAASAAADAAAELVRKNYRQNNTRQAAPWTTHKPPPVEIAGADESGGVTDIHSVAVSSVSTDDFASPVHIRNNTVQTSTARSTSGRSWQSPKAKQGTPPTPKSPGLTAEQMERIIEERVQVQLSELESRMESQMLRLEGRLEDRMRQRMDSLETKMDQIGTLLVSMTRTPNNRREY